MLAISKCESHSGISSICEVCRGRNLNCWSTEGAGREKYEGFLTSECSFFLT